MTTLTGQIIEIGTDPDTGLHRVIVETTVDQIRDLTINPYGKQCRIELSDNTALLSEVEQALDDWIVTYAQDCCSIEQVIKAQKRLLDRGGTLAYVTNLRDRVNSANEKGQR